MFLFHKPKLHFRGKASHICTKYFLSLPRTSVHLVLAVFPPPKLACGVDRFDLVLAVTAWTPVPRKLCSMLTYQVLVVSAVPTIKGMPDSITGFLLWLH